MSKRMLGMDVLTAARERIAWAFEAHARVYLSFSAGKDSTVMLHLVADEARKRNRRFGLLLIDLEGQYRVTIEHGLRCYEDYADVADPYWVCLPIALRNAVSVYQPKWQCWDPDNQEAWIRQPPPLAITDPATFPFFHRNMEFEEFVPLFGEWYAQGEPTACLVGIRTAESLNRYRTIASTTKTTADGRMWTTLVTPHVHNVYPIYDWRTEDIWAYHGKHPDRPYNRLYDLMAMAGLTIHQMRICQPYGDDQRRGLWLFHLIEPETWARVVARVNGANGGALYIQEWGNINGYRKVTKPEGHTWRSFAELLISSMPPATSEHYRNKIMLHEKWWVERGYTDGMPDESPYELEAQRLAPSWRRVCKSLLRNDHYCKGLGFTQQKSDAYQAYRQMMAKRRERWHVNSDRLGFSVRAPLPPPAFGPPILPGIQDELPLGLTDA
jgi:predicted phosphoadenosine phosphosulfate sulfurtransferase